MSTLMVEEIDNGFLGSIKLLYESELKGSVRKYISLNESTFEILRNKLPDGERNPFFIVVGNEVSIPVNVPV